MPWGQSGGLSQALFVGKRKKHQENSWCFLCWHYLSSRAVARQVLSAQASLTSVFGMGTGGPSEWEQVDPRCNQYQLLWMALHHLLCQKLALLTAC